MTLNIAYRSLGFALLSIMLLWVVRQQVEGATVDQKTVSPYQVSVEETGLVITWSADSVSWESTSFGMRPVIDQYSHIQKPGQPQLPVHTVTFAIPADATLDFNVDYGASRSIADTHPIPLAPKPHGILTNQAGDWIGGDFVEALKLSATTNRPIVSVEEIGVMGGIRLGRATFSPLVSKANGLSLIPTATVAIKFSPTSVLSSKHKNPTSSIAKSAVSQLVVNSQHAVPTNTTLRSNQVAPTTAEWVIQVEKEGVVRIEQGQLSSFGINPNQLNPARLKLTHLGEDVPLLWSGDGDDLFESGESFTFYAPESHSRWSATTPFLLSNSDSPSPQMASRAGAPAGAPADGLLMQRVVIEQNNLYTAECGCGRLPVGWDGDRWIWEEMRRPGAPALTIEANLENFDGSQPAFLTPHLIGFTEQFEGSNSKGNDHVVSVKLNGATLGTLRWDGKTADRTKLTIPAGVLQSTNSVELELIDEGRTIDGIWVDMLEFEYSAKFTDFSSQATLSGETTPKAYKISSSQNLSVFDVTEPYTPTLVTGLQQNLASTVWSDNGQTDRRYVVQTESDYYSPATIQPSTGLNGHGAGATYVVIAPAQFAGSQDLANLIAHRESVGWQTHLETAEEIYVAFGDGDPKPEAIRDYLDWAYHTWETRPEMVLLVGDGSTDPKQHKGGTATYIPPFLAEVDPWIGETAADNLMVSVDGVDHVPDMALGRLPVNSVEELAGVVQKILRYEQVKTVGSWNQNVLVVADDNDAAGDFVVASSILINSYFEQPWHVVTEYFGIDSANAPDAQNSVLQQWQRGAGLVMYNGHSSRHQWAAERLFHIDDVANLQNGRRLPLVIQMTCFTGSFQSSRFNTLDEQLVRQSDGGAIAVWGATGLGVATGHGALADGAFNALYGQENPTLGLAVLAGKAKLAAEEPAHLDLLNTFNLLGDPATIIKLEGSGENIFLPTIMKE